MGNAQGVFVNGKDGAAQVAEKTDLMARTIEKLALGEFGDLDRAGLPYFKVKRTSDFYLAPNGDVEINWQQKVADPDGMWGPGTPALLRVNTPGLWLLIGQVRYPPGINGSRASKVLIGGRSATANSKASRKLPFENTGEGTTLQPATIFPLGVGEELYLNTWHSATREAYQDMVLCENAPWPPNNPGIYGNLGFGGTWFAGVWLGPTYGVGAY